MSERFSLALAALIALVALPLVAGCVNWSGDVGRYRAVLDDAQPATRPTYGGAEPLALRDALRVANADNEAIAVAGEDYVQALAEKMRQAGNFLPTLSLDPAYTVIRTKNANGGGVIVGGTGTGTTGGTGTAGTDAGTTTGGTVLLSSGGGGTTDRFSVPANASLNAALTDVSSYRSAGRSVEQRRQLLLDQRETVLLGVAQAYYDVLRFERQTEVLQNSVRLREEQVRDQEQRLKLGNGRPLDVAQGRSDLAATRASLIAAQAGAANARSALARLMGVAEIAGPLTDAFDPPGDVPPVADWLDAAPAGRQDLLAASRALEAARLAVQAAINRYFPSVSINFNYFLYNDPKSSQQWTGGISANIPIFSALSIEAQIRLAWSQYRQAGLFESQIRRQVVDDVRQNRQNLDSSRGQVEQLRTQVEAAQQAADLADRAYRLGSGTNLDRLQQQDALLTAQLNLLDEQFASKTDYLGLLRAAGRLATALQ